MTVRPPVPACAVIAREMGEPVRATAPLAHGWVLLEQPGAWGPEALVESDLDPIVGATLAARAADAGVRAHLIRRRPGRYAATPRRAVLVHTSRTAPWAEELLLDDPAELLDVDLAVARADRAPGLGRAVEERLVLVCTHGRHDPCCATFGRPLVRALQHRSEEVWECSHVGGDRFAANVVCLPEGVYYGHVDPDDADRLLDAHAAGHLDLDHLRGRTTEPMVVQAAEHAVRARWGITGLDDVAPVEWNSTGSGEHRVVLRWAGEDAVVHLVDDPLPPRATTCHDEEDWGPNHFRVVDVRRLGT